MKENLVWDLIFPLTVSAKDCALVNERGTIYATVTGSRGIYHATWCPMAHIRIRARTDSWEKAVLTVQRWASMEGWNVVQSEWCGICP